MPRKNAFGTPELSDVLPAPLAVREIAKFRLGQRLKTQIVVFGLVTFVYSPTATNETGSRKQSKEEKFSWFSLLRVGREACPGGYLPHNI